MCCNIIDYVHETLLKVTLHFMSKQVSGLPGKNESHPFSHSEPSKGQARLNNLACISLLARA